MNQPSAKVVPNTPETHESDENVDVPGAPDTVSEKLDDIMTPGFQAEFDPEEAESAGAFSEDALSEDDAPRQYAGFCAYRAPFAAAQILAALPSIRSSQHEQR